MKLKSLFLLLTLFVFYSSCKNNSKPSKNSINTSEKKSVKNISELTYVEIYYALFTNNNGGMDFHGDAFGQGAVSSLSMTEVNDDCGKGFFLTNTSDKNIDLAVKSSFSFPGNPTNEIVRAYKIKPAEKISIGNSKLCYDGKEFMIQKDVISAGFSTNLEK
ncbi:hypothetical protein RQM59_00795 [Flavobacteriaceae bacterium S356]|uniref:Lipoprotein n=1 Tax=Asprobacillus argus TaxID=3076534 RepID=A0ABU3LAX6_9FLAO|nr:hypothetical protein [Flavobacteriaceae bacterium S356]